MMANLREPYAGTTMASLMWSDIVERAIDRVAAAGKGSDLGRTIWKARYQDEGAAWLRLREMLLPILRAKYPHDRALLTEALVRQAIFEYKWTKCTECKGRGEHVVEDLRITCNICHGTTTRLYKDQDRARSMEITLKETIASNYKLQWLLGLMQGEDDRFNKHMTIELERSFSSDLY